MHRRFSDRNEAGRLLAEQLVQRDYERPVALALPRGGAPVAAEIAKALAAPMDLMLVRKIGTPGQPELALGAVVDGAEPQIVINDDVRRQAGVSDADLELAIERQLAEIDRRRDMYLAGRKRVPVRDRTAIVVDDGIATGATVRAAVKGLRLGNPAKLVLAVPVAPSDTLARLEDEVDEIVCLQTPEPFYAVGLYYRDFDPVSDEDVVSIFSENRPDI